MLRGSVAGSMPSSPNRAASFRDRYSRIVKGRRGRQAITFFLREKHRGGVILRGSVASSMPSSPNRTASLRDRYSRIVKGRRGRQASTFCVNCHCRRSGIAIAAALWGIWWF